MVPNPPRVVAPENLLDKAVKIPTTTAICPAAFPPFLSFSGSTSLSLITVSAMFLIAIAKDTIIAADPIPLMLRFPHLLTAPIAPINKVMAKATAPTAIPPCLILSALSFARLSIVLPIKLMAIPKETIPAA